jgi:hypothetical protein
MLVLRTTSTQCVARQDLRRTDRLRDSDAYHITAPPRTATGVALHDCGTAPRRYLTGGLDFSNATAPRADGMRSSTAVQRLLAMPPRGEHVLDQILDRSPGAAGAVESDLFDPRIRPRRRHFHLDNPSVEPPSTSYRTNRKSATSTWSFQFVWVGDSVIVFRRYEA